MIWSTNIFITNLSHHFFEKPDIFLIKFFNSYKSSLLKFLFTNFDILEINPSILDKLVSFGFLSTSYLESWKTTSEGLFLCFIYSFDIC